MKALILKDCYVLWKQMRIFVLLIAVMSVLNSSFYTLFAVIWAAMLPYTAIAYDERSHWDQLASMMPYSTRDLVLSKYVLGWLCMAAALLLCLIVQTGAGIFNHTAPDYALIAMSFFVGIITLDITLPLVFRFGVERGRMGFMLLIVAIAILGGIVLNVETIGGNLLGLPVHMVILLPAAALIATVLSIPLSIRMYQNQNRS